MKRIFVKFGRVDAYGEDCAHWSLFNGHVLIFKSQSRFRWIFEII